MLQQVSNMIAYNWIRVPHFYILIVSNISFLIDMFFYNKKKEENIWKPI